MPHKANAARRHHIPQPKRTVTNWAEYDAALRQRGSLTVWVTDEAIEQWKAAPRRTPGGQASYSDLAITTALMLRAVFRLALRQTGGLIGSVLHLLGVNLPVPDHSTIARRARTVTLPSAPRSNGGPVHLLVDSTGRTLCGPGEWLIEKHGTKKRRSWQALHIGMDADTGRIVAATLTERGVDDASQVGPLLDQITKPVASVTGDGAYDRTRVYAAIQQRHPKAVVVAPPRSDAVLSDTARPRPARRPPAPPRRPAPLRPRNLGSGNSAYGVCGLAQLRGGPRGWAPRHLGNPCRQTWRTGCQSLRVRSSPN